MNYRKSMIKFIGVCYRDGGGKCQQQRHCCHVRINSSARINKKQNQQALQNIMHQNSIRRAALFALATNINTGILSSAEKAIMVGWDAGVSKGDDDGG
jgi:hypothetical protein